MLKKIALILIPALLLTTGIGLARSVGGIPPTPPQTPQPEAVQNGDDYPISAWLNKRFLVLEKTKQDQFFDYSLGRVGARTSRTPYKELAGKILKVISITQDSNQYHITFEEERSKKKYQYETKEAVVNLLFLDDLEKAKNRWLGKTIYSREHYISTYDAKRDEFGKIPVQFGEPLKVIDVWSALSVLGGHDLWIIVETARGEQGYISTSYSWTNSPRKRWKAVRPWEESLFETDPQQLYDWGPAIWQLIKEKKVQIGMTRDQVYFSWGLPKRVNTHTSANSLFEQWVYDGSYLYFDENGRVSSIQSTVGTY